MKQLVWVAALWLAACGGGGTDAGGGPAPAVQLTAPAHLADNLSGTVTLAATPTGAATVSAVEFQVDGIALVEDTTAPYEATVDTAQHAAGQHVLRARARDAAGNVSPWSSATVRFGGSVGVGAAFVKTETALPGIANATSFAPAPDGRLFIAQQDGALRVMKNGALLGPPFAQLQVDARGERGLIGVALHPQFPSNGWVYVHYTVAGTPHNRVSRLVAAGDVSDGSETVLVELPPLSGATNHNGGAIHFGTDGRLFVAVGDNADGPRAQDLSSPFGKLLRVNDDGSIPVDNPFVGTQSGLARAIWAYGLRNPFTFAVQPGTGRIHVNDVGQSTWEEINLGAAGANYGWPVSEGPDNLGANLTGPLFAYRQTATTPPGSGSGGFFTGNAIAGGAFYPGAGPFPAAYRDNYYFADFGSRFVARLDPANDNAAYAFARVDTPPVDLRVGADGALVVLTRSALVRIAAR
jgi:glucose/arabinose dehydrogenase